MNFQLRLRTPMAIGGTFDPNKKAPLRGERNFQLRLRTPMAIGGIFDPNKKAPLQRQSGAFNCASERARTFDLRINSPPL